MFLLTYEIAVFTFSNENLRITSSGRCNYLRDQQQTEIVIGMNGIRLSPLFQARRRTHTRQQHLGSVTNVSDICFKPLRLYCVLRPRALWQLKVS